MKKKFSLIHSFFITTTTLLFMGTIIFISSCQPEEGPTPDYSSVKSDYIENESTVDLGHVVTTEKIIYNEPASNQISFIDGDVLGKKAIELNEDCGSGSHRVWTDQGIKLKEAVFSNTGNCIVKIHFKFADGREVTIGLPPGGVSNNKDLDEIRRIAWVDLICTEGQNPCKVKYSLTI